MTEALSNGFPIDGGVIPAHYQKYWQVKMSLGDDLFLLVMTLRDENGYLVYVSILVTVHVVSLT